MQVLGSLVFGAGRFNQSLQHLKEGDVRCDDQKGGQENGQGEHRCARQAVICSPMAQPTMRRLHTSSTTARLHHVADHDDRAANAPCVARADVRGMQLEGLLRSTAPALASCSA